MGHSKWLVDCSLVNLLRKYIKQLNYVVNIYCACNNVIGPETKFTGKGAHLAMSATCFPGQKPKEH